MKPGYKQTEVGVIPEEWEVMRLGECVRSDAPICYGILMPGPHCNDGVPVVKVRDINEGSINESALLLAHPSIDEAYKRSRLLHGDVLITIRGTTGRVAITSAALKGANITQDTARIRLGDRVSTQFIYYELQSEAAQKYVLLHTIGQAVKGINIRDVRTLTVTIPPLPEQRAIATALSDVDGLLGGLDRLIAKKRDLKQAAMQQLLTGQTRLLGFHGEWEDTTLGELATFLSGGTPSRSNDDYWTGDIPWISASSLRCFEIWRSDSNVTRDAVAAGSKMAPVGSSLLLVRGSALHNEILCGLVTKPVCFNQDVKALVPRSHVMPSFLTLFIRGTAENFLSLVSSAGNTAGVLDTKLLKAFAIKLPPLPEQTAIASVLTEMDAELAVLTQRREKTRALKQAMMQELLTGKTRLI